MRKALSGTGHQVWDPLDKHGARESWDLTKDDVFVETLEKIRRHRPMWIHMAPPCRTFTRARDGRRDGGPGRLRSDAKPEGWGPEAEEGNLLALRAEAFAEEQEKGGRLFTVEHPLRSYMWDLKPFKKRRKEGRGTLVALDQCAFGASHQKPTGLLTNGECFHALAKRCIIGKRPSTRTFPLRARFGMRRAGARFGAPPSRRHTPRGCAARWRRHSRVTCSPTDRLLTKPRRLDG